MSADSNKAVVRKFYEEIWNKGNLAVTGEVMTPDAVLHDPIAGGPVPIARVLATLIPAERSAFPDIQFTIEDAVSEDDRVVVRWNVQGTHKGDYMGVAGTGLRVMATGMTMVKIADGKIAEMWLNMDDLGLRRTLGMVKD